MNAERLLTLAKFLREKVPDKCWDFHVVMKLGAKSPHDAFESGGGCGTVGCAMGWMPQLFPDDVTWRKNGNYPEVVMVDGTTCDTDATARKFFELRWVDVDYLFYPEEENPDYCRPSPSEVAERIEQFVKDELAEERK